MAPLTLNDVKHFAGNSGLREASARLPDGSWLLVRHPSEDDLGCIHALGQAEISRTVAELGLVQAVYKHNRDTFWGVYRGGDAGPNVRLVGYYAFLHLNATGLAALQSDSFDGACPAFGHLVGEGGTPVAVYVWAIVARKVARVATVLVAKALGRDRYGGVPIYGRAATLGGVASLRSYGFDNLRPSSSGIGDLYRLDPETPQAHKPAA